MISYASQERLGLADMALLALFVIGIYTGIDAHVSATIPIPSVLAGAAGLVLLYRRRDDIAPEHLMAFLVVVLVYLGSIFAADGLAYLPKRFTGLVQLVYSFVAAYAVFLTMMRGDRRQLAGLFLVISLVILLGAILEDYGPLRPISDAVRAHLYDPGIVYDADRRDLLLYNRIRPKVFASEPSAVTFAYSLLSFVWLMLSRARLKLLIYVGLMGAGMIAMPGPTLLLMVLLLLPYILIATRGWGDGILRGIVGIGACVILGVVFVTIGELVYTQRLHEILNGQDASFFYRVTGPALLTQDVMRHHPLAGTGLTGENFIADEVMNVYVRSPDFSPEWTVANPLTTAFITNYVWLHWIYLGAVWGVAAIAALTFWLKTLRVPSAPFCWIVWTIMGQASGAYVGPKTWAVLFIAAACATLAWGERAASTEWSPIDEDEALSEPAMAREAARW